MDIPVSHKFGKSEMSGNSQQQLAVQLMAQKSIGDIKGFFSSIVELPWCTEVFPVCVVRWR